MSTKSVPIPGEGLQHAQLPQPPTKMVGVGMPDEQCVLNVRNHAYLVKGCQMSSCPNSLARYLGYHGCRAVLSERVCKPGQGRVGSCQNPFQM